uniref:PUB domain-containing protein n=1 Tax=Peronospora matthiolae TaxID=2874970 RepID=A0AAV1VC69_9STRA
MDWLNKKKKAAKRAAAKMKNQRSTFQGEGNVLGGTSDASSAPPPPATASSRGPSLKLPFITNKPPALSEQEQQERREQQAKALEQRGNAWDKRVATARKMRLQQEEEQESKFQYTDPVPTTAPSAVSVVLSNEEVKARELQSAQAQMGFNPYAVTISSSTQAVSAMNGIGGNAGALTAESSGAGTSFVPPGEMARAALLGSISADEKTGENGAVYVLLRQDPTRAITAAETLIKMLSNVVKNPQEEKFRKVRLSNASIQSKLVAVPGAIDILAEVGFAPVEIDGDTYLILPADAFQADRVQSAIDRTEVARTQLQHDST